MLSCGAVVCLRPSSYSIDSFRADVKVRPRGQMTNGNKMLSMRAPRCPLRRGDDVESPAAKLRIRGRTLPQALANELSRPAELKASAGLAGLERQ